MYLEFENEINAMIAKMSVREKIGQLNQICSPKTEDDIKICKEKIKNGDVGSVILAGSLTAGNDKQQSVSKDLFNELQRVAVEESRNGIPLIYGRDVIHGHNTVYPVPLASAAAFNPELVEKCYKNIAKEATADGVHWTFSPMLDLCHDPRWGRIVEGPGEDPYVGACFAKAAVKGFQGGDVSKEDSLVSCLKHYIGYGASEGGRDYYRTEISDYTLYNYYLPAFKTAIEENAGTVMSSFNDISGQPVTSSKKYLTDILRNRLGFNGFVVSDWAAVQQLIKQGVAENRCECAKMSLEAGLEMDMCSDCYIENLESLIESGEVSEETLDMAVRRVLRVKFAKGLFEHPYCSLTKPDRTEHLKDAYKIAAESMVLLKNDGVLPLDKNSKVALLGPFINERRTHLGTWSLDFVLEDTKSFLDVMQEKIGKDSVILNTDESGVFDNSVITASKSDVVVLALGDSWRNTGEASSSTDISLSKDQIELIKKVKSTGKKAVGVFFSARPLAMQGVADQLDAVLYAWHCGTKAPEAACDILFGDIVPSGKTAVTFPRVTGQIPIYYNTTSSGRYVNGYYGENSQISYNDCLATPYYPFGYGLSYTEFKYGKPQAREKQISLEELKNGKKFNLWTDVANIGDYDGKETVQLYIYDPSASMMRPLRELKKFKKPFIRKGETERVDFELGYGDIGFYNEKGEYTVEEGKLYVLIGKDCLVTDYVELKIVG